MKIDMHTHIIPRDCFDLVDRQGRNHGPSLKKDASGHEFLMIGNRPSGTITQLCDPGRIIKDMDKIGLDAGAFSLPPYTLFYSVDPEDGLLFCRRQNNAMSQVAKAYPDRIIGMANVPLQDVSKAVPELERAVRELGLKGVAILGNINGKNLDEPEFWPFYQKAEELDIPIYIHPWGEHAPGAERMKKYWFENLLANPMDTTLAAASIIFGGVLESFPKLRFLFSHAGGYTPFIRGRWERGWQYKREEAQNQGNTRFIESCRSTPKPPSEYLKLMYFDTVTHFGPALAYLVDTMGADRVVMGSDYPFPMGIDDPISQVRNAAGISAADKQKILEQTAVTLLNL